MKVDKYHRVVFKDGYYIPEYKPTLFRSPWFGWLFSGAWSHYSRYENIQDSTGVLHEVRTKVGFKFEDEAIEAQQDSEGMIMGQGNGNSNIHSNFLNKSQSKGGNFHDGLNGDNGVNLDDLMDDADENHNGDLDEVYGSCMSVLTWYEEWFFFFEQIWGRTFMR